MRRAGTLATFVSLVRRHPYETALVVMTCLFVAFRIWRTVSGSPVSWNDSFDYEKVAGNAWLSRGLWSGPRPPIASVLWKLTGSDESYVVIQAVAGGASWSFLAWVVMRLIRPGWRALVAAGLVLAFAACWPVTLWDSSVLSESISTSAMAVLIGCFLALSRHYSRIAVIGAVASGVVFAGARDENIVTLAMFGLAVVAYGNARRKRPGRPHVTRAVTVGLLLVAVAGVAESAALASGRNLQNVENDFAARIFAFPDRVAWFAARGMPESGRIDSLARATAANPGYGKLVYPDLSAAAWRPLKLWFDDHGESDYVLYLITHPGYVFTAPFVRPELTFNDFNGDVSLYGAGAPEAPGIAHVLFPAWGVVLGIGLAGGALIVARRLWKRREVLAIAGLCVIGLASMLVAWHGDGQEIVRHMIEGDVMARLAAMLGLLAGAFGLAPVPRPTAVQPGE